MRAPPSSTRRSSRLTLALQATRHAFAFVAVFSAAINVLLLTVPLYMMQMFDRVIASRSYETLIFLTLIAAGATLLLALLEYLRSRLLSRVVGYLDRFLASEAFERSVTGALRGRAYTSESLRDLATLRGFLGSTGIAAICDAPWAIVYLAVVFLIHPGLGGIAAGGAVILLVIALSTEFLTRGPLREASVAQMRAMRRVEAAGRNAEAITAMGMMPELARIWAGENREATAHHERAAARSNALLATTKLVRLLLQLGFLGAAGWLVVQQELTAGAMVAGSLVFGRALAPVEQALASWRGFIMARTAHERLKLFFAEGAGAAEAMPLPPPKGRLQVERLSFALPGSDRLVLKGVSFDLGPGQALAIIGPSGAGKSTLARLLVGLLKPTAGHVRLDSADVWLWNRTELGRWIGFVPQDVELFAGTIAQNIARMADADAKEVVRAAEIADLHDLILRLPRGYDTEIGDGGTMLSGGQRQRIALARAIYGRPRFLVLDEPNSNLDREGEEALAGAIGRLKAEGCAIVIVTHRQNLLVAVDKLVVLRDGVVMLAGERAAVLERLQKSDGPRRIQDDPAVAPRRPALAG
ncbi:MAG: type I secretion system permease/ATPase [Alphaproteobacteria bacterium]|nr:type I secretion system permease/ATPase [Alphaproteobacteria bacterium]